MPAAVVWPISEVIVYNANKVTAREYYFVFWYLAAVLKCTAHCDTFEHHLLCLCCDEQSCINTQHLLSSHQKRKELKVEKECLQCLLFQREFTATKQQKQLVYKRAVSSGSVHIYAVNE